ncbi:MAG TPA: cupin domain-containing protein [Thermoanaerobaculia bacterium]|nr:cupin domain-containing protein [Thermoanaerobaculia bacterium]
MRAYPLEEPSSAIAPEQLARRGILSWSVPPEDGARAALIETIKREHGYVDEDFVELGPETPNLDAICAKFDREHFHSEDEVRFVVAGAGIFDVRDEADRWIRIEVYEGDLIVIPANTHHRFYLTDTRQIRCMRLFANHDGWAPLYRESPAAG